MDSPSLTPTLDQYRLSPSSHIPDSPRDDPLTIPELNAIADDVLGEHSKERKYWDLINSSEGGRTCLRTLALRAGYPDDTSNAGASAHMRDIISRMEDRGISRARAFQLKSGFTAQTVAETLARVMRESVDDRTATRAADVAAKCLGMQSTAPRVSVTVNTQVNLAVGQELGKLLGE